MGTPFSVVTQLVIMVHGGVHAEKNSNVTISGNTTFANNSASYDGGLRAWYGSNMNISGNTTLLKKGCYCDTQRGVISPV